MEDYDCNFVQDVFKIFHSFLFCLEIGPSVETDCKIFFVCPEIGPSVVPDAKFPKRFKKSCQHFKVLVIVNT